jgi:methyltransferase-like protein/SAM-dependent methyltransferase
MESSYDEIPYKSSSFSQTHPNRLATLGRIFGLTPAPVTRCRVLELGCAGGGNLLPMAFNLPDGEFVGVDLSVRHVQQATKAIEELELKNVRIENASILDFDQSWGTFDYIICHGVYSWVPKEVQDKILAVSSANLAPQGIAYVSYNTYPGWHLREMIRYMMRYHINQFEDTAKRIEQARALIDFLAGSVSTENYYGLMLKSELDVVKRSKDWYLFHDHLEEINAPIYFHQFVDRAAKHHLQYLAEADFSTMLSSGFPTEVADTLKRICPNIIRKEQYMDFLRNRFFRQTLLCHQNLSINRNLNAESLNGLLVASPASPESDPMDLSPGQKQSFRTPSGLTFNTDFPPTKAALAVLHHHWPKAIDQDWLKKEAYQQLVEFHTYRSTDKDWNTVLGDLLHCYTLNIVEFHTWQAAWESKVTERPKACRLAAYQSSKGQAIANQRHEHVVLDAIGNELIRVLDGSRNHKALREHLKNLVEAGTLNIRQNEEPLENQELIEQTLDLTLKQTLKKLALITLLVE